MIGVRNEQNKVFMTRVAWFFKTYLRFKHKTSENELNTEDE